jgi:hypothetical protein
VAVLNWSCVTKPACEGRALAGVAASAGCDVVNDGGEKSDDLRLNGEVVIWSGVTPGGVQGCRKHPLRSLPFQEGDSVANAAEAGEGGGLLQRFSALADLPSD